MKHPSLPGLAPQHERLGFLWVGSVLCPLVHLLLYPMTSQVSVFFVSYSHFKILSQHSVKALPTFISNVSPLLRALDEFSGRQVLCFQIRRRCFHIYYLPVCSNVHNTQPSHKAMQSFSPQDTSISPPVWN